MSNQNRQTTINSINLNFQTSDNWRCCSYIFIASLQKHQHIVLVLTNLFLYIKYYFAVVQQI